MNKTSKEDFEYFQDQCLKYIKQLGLLDFKIYWEHAKHPDAYAYITPEVNDGQAVIGLAINWGTQKVTKQMLTYCAKHEVLHLLIADLVEVGKRRNSIAEDFTRAQHAIIRRLENWN